MAESLRRNAEAVKRISGRGGPVGPTEPVEMGGDGLVHEEGVVVGREVGVELRPGVKVKIGAKARVVMGADGIQQVVGGGSGQPISVYEAGKVLPPVLDGKVRRGLGRNREGRKRKLGL